MFELSSMRTRRPTIVKRILYCAALVLIIPAAARAQATVTLAAGASVPVGNSLPPLNAGYTATLGLGAKPPQARVGIRLEGMFNSMSLSDATSPGATKRIVSGTLNGTVSPSGRTAPLFYAIGGIGVYSTKLNGVTSPQQGNNDMGFNVGLGSNLPGTGFSTFIEARYHHIPTEGGALKFIPITLGLRL
jgi:hypothetical protein